MGEVPIGLRWWSRRFTTLLDTGADPERLRAGRELARAGEVAGLRVGPYEVTAKVRGPDGEPYDVAVGTEGIDTLGWRAAEARLASHAVFRARLLAGELPPEIEWQFAELGLALFPDTAADLHLMCGCPGWGDPCEHAAAVLYLLAEAFDDDPFLVLEWNGRPRERLLAALRRESAVEPDPFEMDAEPLSATGFWTPPSGLARLRERRRAVPVPPGFVLQVATPPPVRIRRRDLPDVLAPAYEALAAETPDRDG
ncbi:SWIM zinc finger family protein [Actinomadura litoris]|uniref:SWIM zinc finger family protein n=1 Tax=Actinomadura litoris TaxID=2678616 RepID=UPI001FA765DC|nr:SWIM zinc finger family protein [Actinomadura litoris]